MGTGAQQTQADQSVALPAGIWYFSRGSEPARELTIFTVHLGMSVSLPRFDKDSLVAVIEYAEPWDTYDQFLAGGQS